MPDSIVFRHPMLLDAKGKPGRLICIGVATLPERERGDIKDGLKLLKEKLPGVRADAEKMGVCAAACDAWFKALTKHADERAAAAIRAASTKVASTYTGRREDTENRNFSEDLIEEQARRIAALETANEKLEQEKATAENRADGMQDAFGDRAEHAKRLTLAQCWDHFRKTTDCKSEAAKREVLRRVYNLVKALGEKTKHGDIDGDRVRKAIAGMDASPTEKSRTILEAKRFFREIAFPVKAGGLGLADPAAAIKRRNVFTRKIETLDPRTLIKALPPYWQALVAVLGYGGLRLSEAASLTWAQLDEDAGLIRVRANDVYPDLKNMVSERDVKPFDEAWGIIAKYRKVSRHETVVFDRPGKKGPTWFMTYDGKPRAMLLSKALIDAIGAVMGMRCELKDGRTLMLRYTHEKPYMKDGVRRVNAYLHPFDGSDMFVVDREEIVALERPDEPARRLRRWWETEMRAAGKGDLIVAMGGHSNEVGLAHYTKFERIVEKAEVGSVGKGRRKKAKK